MIERQMGRLEVDAALERGRVRVEEFMSELRIVPMVRVVIGENRVFAFEKRGAEAKALRRMIALAIVNAEDAAREDVSIELSRESMAYHAGKEDGYREAMKEIGHE